MKRVYYAHCLAIYNTPQEKRDIETLEALGFNVINPNCPETAEMVRVLKEQGRDDYMRAVFAPMVKDCDAVVFRGLPDGRVPAGIAGELEYASEYGRPVIELPSAVLSRTMTVAQTREYLKESGQR